MSIPIGLKGEAKKRSEPQHTALHQGSGELSVFSTPSMIAFMEEACWKSIAPYLTPEESSVGTHIDIKHISATPLGVEVRVESEVIAVEGKCITFTVTAYDSHGVIGSGNHQRYIIQQERFQQKAEEKSSPLN